MSSDCKIVTELCQKVAKVVAAVKELRAEGKAETQPLKPEEIEMEVFWRSTIVRFTEPAEKWSEIRRRREPTAPIDIVYPKREQDW